jgi:hypothetical protein
MTWGDVPVGLCDVVEDEVADLALDIAWLVAHWDLNTYMVANAI